MQPTKYKLQTQHSTCHLGNCVSTKPPNFFRNLAPLLYFLQNKKHIGKLSAGQTKKGFAFLFAALTTSLLMSIGLVILRISVKNAVFSGIAEESQLAIYAADTGFECALFWDLQRNAFNPLDDSQIIQCADDTAIVGGGVLIPATYTFSLTKSTCSNVRVTKTMSSGRLTTRIVADGFNTCEIGHPRRVQRTFEATY